MTIARFFVRDWVIVHIPPAKVLSDNGKPLTSKIFQISQTVMAKFQKCFKRDFDKRMIPAAPIKVGYQVYLERQEPSANFVADGRQRHELQSNKT
eukprot:IDg13103t1